MRNFFINYQTLIQSPEFIKFTKTLSMKMEIELSKNKLEVKTVKNWITALSNQGFQHNGYKVNINSLFIHGYTASGEGSHPSGVEFDYCHNKKDKENKSNKGNKELADIIFISSYFHGGKKVLEKVTFNQAKWGKVSSTTSSWKIEKDQLYLLSRLPRFNGVNGSIISNKDYYINNISECLTSYGLMNEENFIFISANYLLTAIAGKGTVNLKDFQSLNTLKHNLNTNYPMFDDKFLDYLERYYGRNIYSINMFKTLLENSSVCFANNTFEFISEYLKGNIGEITHNELDNTINSSAKTLMDDIIRNINSIPPKNINKDEAKQFIKNYGGSDNININDNYEFEESNNSMGIVQVKINLEGG